HPALYETAAMAAARPARGSHPPGTFWYYNNWDFNALGTIYERATDEGIFDAFERRIARPIGMEDYRPADGTYVRGADSIHPAYPIRMSARDLARFALLYLNQGRWEGRQVVPADWVAASTRSYSAARSGTGYGYLWWVGFADLGRVPTVRLPPGSFSAQGYRGQFAFVMPALDLVVVHRVNSDGLTDPTGVVPDVREVGRLLWLVLTAAGVPDVGPDGSLAAASGARPSGEALRGALAGTTLALEARGIGAMRLTLRRDGIAEYRRDAAAAVETGTWSIEGDRLCRGRSPFNRRAACHTVVLDGARADLFDANGLLEFAAVVSRD
ncbi:MAG: serine hydrolase, partial [Alphaproteobacteria bacterium]|nr:serine hydrolase [Alphaproteobacteria bacterium]